MEDNKQTLYKKYLKNIYVNDHSNNGLENFFKSTINMFSNSLLCVDENGNSYKYKNIFETLERKTKILIKRKLIFCLCDNNADSLMGYFLFLAEQAIPMMIKLDTSKEQLSNLLEKYSPAYVWVNKEKTIDHKNFKEIDSFGDYRLLATGYKEYKVHPSLGLLIGTSGSTGNTKFVRLSYRNIISNAFSIGEYLKIDNKENVITTLKPSYTFALSILHSHLIKGAKISITSKTMFERNFWNFLEDIQATSLSGVPYHYEILRKLKIHKFKIKSIKTMTQAGGRLDLETAEYFKKTCFEKNINFYIMYGQSEGTARLSYLDPKYLSLKLGSIGNAIPGGKFHIKNPDNTIVKEFNKKGELVYSGSNVSMGYANSKDDLGKFDENNFILNTGDIAYQDEDGFYFIVGRLKRFIKLFGHRINLLDLEIWFEKYSIKCVCKGNDDSLEMYIQEEQIEIFEKKYDKFIKEFKIPKHVITKFVLKKFPIGESGKILYKKIDSKIAKKLE